jgi:peptide/nickel transport system substrate-binding protein
MPNGLEIRIELEPDVTFHDGRPLTTSDVQFTLDSVRDASKHLDHLRAMLDDVEAIELITSHEIRLRLKRPSGWVLRALAEIPIMPMHVYDGSMIAGGALVGTGPWKLVSNKNGVVHLTRFENYWGKHPAIADLEFVYQPDAAIALTAAKRGELDIVPALIPAHWPEQASAPGVASTFRPLELAPPRLRYFAFNATRIDDARVRHALSLLIDRRAIARRVFDGLSRPALWPIWPGGPVSGA